MLRSDLNIIMDYVRSASGRATLAQMSRGTITIDAAALAGVTSGDLVGSAFGIAVKRDSGLADGKFAYKNEAGSTLLSN